MRWRLIVITAEGIYDDPLRTLERVRDALIERGASRVRRIFKPEWRVHFPTDAKRLKTTNRGPIG